MAKGERFKWLKGLTLTLQILFWSIVGLEGLALGLWTIGAALGRASWETFYSLGGMPFLLALVLQVPVVVVLPVWTAVTAAARPRKGGDGTQLWAWLGYLIPLVSYVAPVLVLRSVAREAAPSNSGLRVLALVFWFARLTTSSAGILALLLIAGQTSSSESGVATIFAIFAICLLAGSLLGAQLIPRLKRAVIAHTTGAEQASVF
jgi:hypothetical protein